MRMDERETGGDIGKEEETGVVDGRRETDRRCGTKNSILLRVVF